MSVAATLLALTIAVVSVDCATLPVLATVSGCVYQGQWYPEGPFQPDPCSPCHCDHGQTICAVVDCFFTPCVDPVHDPKQCCPVCPNGPNCQAPDGQVISSGQDVQIDPNTICRCDPHGGLGFMSMNQAMCLLKPNDTISDNFAVS